ncbi:MAG: hypothetical protein ACI9DC_003867 [Gammaproteobacteria bacterium]|jgi:hypothetical protein
MSEGSHHEGPHRDADSGQSNDQADGRIVGQNGAEPPRPPSVPEQGVRKRTSLFVGIGFVLFGLLMLYIVGDSAASGGSVQCPVPSSTQTHFCNDTGDIH